MIKWQLLKNQMCSKIHVNVEISNTVDEKNHTLVKSSDAI